METIALFTAMSFTLVAGFLLGYVQRLVGLQEKQNDLLEQLLKKQEQEATKNEGLPAGIYAIGEPDPRTGQAHLIPMRQ